MPASGRAFFFLWVFGLCVCSAPVRSLGEGIRFDGEGSGSNPESTMGCGLRADPGVCHAIGVCPPARRNHRFRGQEASYDETRDQKACGKDYCVHTSEEASLVLQFRQGAIHKHDA